MAEKVAELSEAGERVPLVIVDDRGADALTALSVTPWGREIRTMVVSSDPEIQIRTGSDAQVSGVADESELRSNLDRLITSFLIDEEPETLETVPEVVDVELLTHAYSESEHRQRVTDAELGAARRGFLAHRDLTDDEIELAMIDEIDRVLGGPERKVYRAGETLIERGHQVDGVMVVIDGQIRLSLNVDGEDVPFHVRTAGRILGILSLARSQPAFFDCRAGTDVTVVEIGSDQLDWALRESPTLNGLFVSVLLRSLARRNRRGAEMRLEINELARALRLERDHLAEALRQLEQAQAQLIEQEKMAMLGTLVAGVAHELNNPLAAILRATEFVEEDITMLTREHPKSRLLTDVLLGALEAQPVSTREQRERRRTLASALGDEALAQRFVEAGFGSLEAVEAAFGGLEESEREELLTAVEGHHRLGSAIRNLRSGAKRISALVHSLRSYGRKPGETVSDLDVAEGLEETLLLLGHRLDGILVDRGYEPVPPISGSPGELNQVWTNLIVNAIEVMGGEGTLSVGVREVDGGVRVEITDSGPGIAEEHMDRIFEMDFTTKQGRVDFGLGLGLRIALDIVTRHGGKIDVDSEPGRTCFAVTLPIGGANA